MSRAILPPPEAANPDRPERLRTTNLAARRAAQTSDVPAALGSTSRRFAHWTKARAASLRQLADAADRDARPPHALYPGLADVPTLAPLPPFAPLTRDERLPDPYDSQRQADLARLPAWVRAECSRLNLDGQMVAAAYDHLCQAEEATHRRRELRQNAWLAHNANRPGCWGFWRAGFRTRYGKRVDAHDYTAIPGYDVLHQQFLHDYPDYSDEYAFWCELLGPLPRLTPARELWQAALDLAQESGDSSPSSLQYGDQHDAF